MRRQKLISEIYKHAEVINANKTTLVFLIATMTDKALSKFHKEFMSKEPYIVSDILILLERKNPTIYEIHRGKIQQTKNLILTTKDKEFAEQLVNGYNSLNS